MLSIGKIDTQLYLSKDEKTLYFGESRERIQDSQRFHDHYLKSVNLTENTLSEKRIYENTSTDIDLNLSSYHFERDMKNAVAYINPYTSAFKVVITDLTSASFASFNPILEPGTAGQISGASWSTNGSKLVFAVSNVGKSIPEQEGIWLYDNATKRVTQLLKSTILNPTDETTGIMRVVEGSFNGDFLSIM